MIDFYYWPTPNGWKVSIMLEECGLDYNLIPINIGRGEQFRSEFLAISPNNRMPAIVDHDGEGEHPYSSERYNNEYNRCLGVLERRLEGRPYLLGEDYSIADMASWPWVLIARPLGQTLEEFPNVRRWRQTIKERPAVQKGVDLGSEFRRQAPPDDAERRILFGQNSRSTGPTDA